LTFKAEPEGGIATARAFLRSDVYPVYFFRRRGYGAPRNPVKLTAVKAEPLRAAYIRNPRAPGSGKNQNKFAFP
jgi:hypothetical protein